MEKMLDLLPPADTLATSEEWCVFFAVNARHQMSIPWERGAELTEKERAVICPSLAAWQLGETSDGRHLLLAATRYAKAIGDPDYVEAIRLFIQEEQGHGEALGQFLDIAGVPRLRRNWGDSLFRFMRYLLPNMEAWTTPVILVEALAQVYYRAVRNASGSAVLRRICHQILKDEVAHIRFQCERFAIMHQNRPPALRAMTYACQRVLFSAVTLLVWAGHHTVLRAGGHTFGTYWREAWARMGYAWSRMEPERYTSPRVKKIRFRWS